MKFIFLNPFKTFFSVILLSTGLILLSNLVSAQNEDMDPDLKKTVEGFRALGEGNQKLVLDSMGIPASQGLSIGVLLGGLLFGSIGMIAFIYGKKMASFRPMLIGIILIVFPYFVSNIFLLFGVGIGLTAALFFFKE